MHISSVSFKIAFPVAANIVKIKNYTSETIAIFLLFLQFIWIPNKVKKKIFHSLHGNFQLLGPILPLAAQNIIRGEEGLGRNVIGKHVSMECSRPSTFLWTKVRACGSFV